LERGSPEEARLLLEVCHHLCQKLGLDKVIRDNLSRIEREAGPPCTCCKMGGMRLLLRSPFNDEPTPNEQPQARERMQFMEKLMANYVK
jgi:hypothetical protein